MCGIAGICTFDGVPEDDLHQLVTRQLETIIHRGGDECGSVVEDVVALGVTRLSIIDIAGGSQPMVSVDGRYVLVYNGEVYNFRELRRKLEDRGHAFRTLCDTEVVLAAYASDGLDALGSLNGMFCFAVWDRHERELLVCRDRFGVKPIYYYIDQRRFCFASEVKGIMQMPGLRREVDPEGLIVYLSHNYLPAPHTLLRGVFQLPPGHAIRVKADGSHAIFRWHHWSVAPDESGGSEASGEELQERFGELFERAVVRQLVSDVPLGVFLSGGLDSTALASVMSENMSEPVKTFSVGFDEPGYDESEYAREAAEQLGTDHHGLRLGPDRFFELLEAYIAHQDNPIADQATIPLFALSLMARKEVKVCLSGDGADELLGGYPTILADRLQPLAARLPRSVRNMITKTLDVAGATTGKVSLDYKLRAFMRGAGLRSREDAHATWRMLHSVGTLRRLLPDGFPIDPEWIYGPYRRAFAERTNGDFHRRAELADLRVWLAGNNLLKVDAMTMGANLEARVPFLDNELVDFLLRVPMAQKTSGQTLKVILRRYLRDKGISSNIVRRRKAGFHSPIARWFKGPLNVKLRALLASSHGVHRDGLIRREEPLRLLDAHQQGRANNAFQLFGLALLFLWYDQMQS